MLPRATIEVQGFRATLDYSRKGERLRDCWTCEDPLMLVYIREATPSMPPIPVGLMVSEAAKAVAEKLGGRVIELVDCGPRPEDLLIPDDPNIIVG